MVAPEPLAAVHRQVINGLRYLRFRRVRAVTVTIPLTLPREFIDDLLQTETVAGVVSHAPAMSESGDWASRTGHFIQARYNWVLPAVAADYLLYPGPRMEISFRMILVSRRAGYRGIAYQHDGGWLSESLYRFMTRRLAERLLYECQRWSNRVISGLFAFFRRAARFVLEHQSAISASAAKHRFHKFERILEQMEDYLHYHRLRESLSQAVFAPGLPLLGPEDFISNRIIYVNSALATGGAERQVVNTILGSIRTGLTDVSLLCERLHEFDGSDFYLWKLQAGGVRVDKLGFTQLEILAQIEGYPALALATSRLPNEIAQTVISYVYEFYQRRPEVVHLWQDSTSICAGIAACIVGVPVIVVSTRNMAPHRFLYHQKYMKPAYQVLLEHECVRFLNNSLPGKLDYIEWLETRPDKFAIVLNGFDHNDIVPVDEQTSRNFREELGLPTDTPVIGSVFRFYHEKDPLLWVKAAAALCTLPGHEKTVFLLIGKGPMHNEIRKLAEDLGIADRLFMPGEMKNPALALSVMDLFLLTSLNEGTPNVVIEAQFCGVPVIATDAGGTRDAIQHEFTGFILENRNPEQIAATLARVLENPSWMAEARRRSTELASQRFGIARMIDDTMDIYGYTNRYPRPKHVNNEVESGTCAE